MNKSKLLFCWCLFVLTLFPACSKDKFPTGSFIREVGSNKMEISGDGSLIIYIGSFVNWATYSVQDNELTWETYFYCDEVGMGDPSTYFWVYENDTLSFHLKGEDKCPVREALLTTSTWIKEDQ